MKANKETRGKRTQNILVKSVLTQQKYQKIQADSSFPVIVKGLILGTHSLSDVKRLAKKYKVHSKTILKIAGMENFTGINKRFPQIDKYIKEETVSSFPKATELRAIMGKSFSFSTVFGSKPIEFLMECGYPIFNTKLKIVFNGDLVKKPDQDKYYHKEKNLLGNFFAQAMNGEKIVSKEQYNRVLGICYNMGNMHSIQDIFSKYTGTSVQKLREMKITGKTAHFEAYRERLSMNPEFKKNPHLLKIALDELDAIKRIEVQKGSFFDDIAKSAGNKISEYVSYEPKGNKAVKEIYGNKRPDLVGEYNNDISFLEVLNYINNSDYMEGIEDKINKVYKAKKKIAIVYTKKIKKKTEVMYSQLSSAKKKFVKLLYIDPKKDELDEMVKAIKEWLIWSKIPFNKEIFADDIFILK